MTHILLAQGAFTSLALLSVLVVVVFAVLQFVLQDARNHKESDAPTTDYEREETTPSLSDRAEEKAAALELLIADADRAARRLETAVGRVREASATASERAAASIAGPGGEASDDAGDTFTSALDALRRLEESVRGLVDVEHDEAAATDAPREEGRSDSDDSADWMGAPRTLASMPSIDPTSPIGREEETDRASDGQGQEVDSALEEGASSAVLEPSPALERRFREVCALADQGFASQEIAQRIGMPIGQVELILGLRRQEQ